MGLVPGDVLTIPGLTMVFGDANGDGVIDVQDLAIGASNLSETSEDLQLPPDQPLYAAAPASRDSRPTADQPSHRGSCAPGSGIARTAGSMVLSCCLGKIT